MVRHKNNEVLPADVFRETILSIKVQVVYLLEVRPEVVCPRPVLGLCLADTVMAAVSDAILPVHTLPMPLEVICGAEPLCGLGTAWFRASVRSLMPRDVLSMTEVPSVSRLPFWGRKTYVCSDRLLLACWQ